MKNIKNIKFRPINLINPKRNTTKLERVKRIIKMLMRKTAKLSESTLHQHSDTPYVTFKSNISATVEASRRAHVDDLI